VAQISSGSHQLADRKKSQKITNTGLFFYPYLQEIQSTPGISGSPSCRFAFTYLVRQPTESTLITVRPHSGKLPNSLITAKAESPSSEMDKAHPSHSRQLMLQFISVILQTTLKNLF
jgi:hypothetical protein